MSRVASDSPAVVPVRPHVPRARNASEDARQPSTPFADLLGTPAAEPPAPRRVRSDRPDKADRTDKPKPADASTDAEPAKDDAAAKDAKAADGTSDTKPVKDAKDGKAADPSKGPKGADAATPAEAKDKPKSETDQSAALTALLTDPATPPVTVTQTAVVAVAQPNALAAAVPIADETTESDALAAVQTEGVSPNAGPKPGEAKPQAQSQVQAQTQSQPQAQTPVQAQPQVPAEAQAEPQANPQAMSQAKPEAKPEATPQVQSAGDKHADTIAKGTTPADRQTAVPQIDAGKDAQARGNGDKSADEFRHATAELLVKLGADAPMQQGNDAGPGLATADVAQNTGVLTSANTTTASAATAPTASNAPAQAPAVTIPLSSLAVEITAQAHAGKSHFEIRLDPPELGRIDVKLNVDRDGNISTHVIADRSDTLDLLKRDASTLERALQQAGLKTSDNALEFSLRQQTFTQHDMAAQNARAVISEDDPAPLEAMRQGYGRLLGLGGGLDIRV